MHPERQYLDLVRSILDTGTFRPDRTGTGTWALHGATMRFDLSDGVLPILTTKRVAWKVAFKEMLWFLSGDRRLRTLLRQDVHIWSDWPHAKYVRTTGDAIDLKTFEARILEDDAFDAAWGDLGPLYGWQWRNWPGPDGRPVDQVQWVLDEIVRNPTSRRLIWHAWNVPFLDEMALPPCHMVYQFFVADGRVSLSLYQRSADTALGVPFNLAGAAFLVNLVARHTGLAPGELFWVGHDVHVYANHKDALELQLAREPRSFPRLVFTGDETSLFRMRIEDVALEGYEPHPAIKMDVAV